MFKELRFALYATKKNIQGSAELRTSFLINVFGMMINNSAFIILWIFFIKSVGVINGWVSADIVGLLGFSALSYGLVHSLATGIKKLPDYVTSGAFDRFMLSPKGLLSRIATSSFEASAIGDVMFGFVCLVIYGFLIHVGLQQILLMLILQILATVIFLATMIAIYSTSFYFTDASSATNGFFELFLTPALFPGGAFHGVMRFIFIFIVPSLLVGSLPVEAVRDISFWKLGLMGIMAVVWMVFSVKFFNRSIKKYESSNFMTFGN